MTGMSGRSGERTASITTLEPESGDPLPDVEESSQPDNKTNTDTMIMYFIVPV